MLCDLTFWDPRLESAFRSHLRRAKTLVVVRWAVFRAALLLFTAGRSLWDTGDLFGSWLLFLVGAASNLAPVVAVTSTTPRFEWSADAAAMLTEVVQAAIGSALHHEMAPSHDVARPTTALLTYLPHGSTVLWIYAYAAFSGLHFRVLYLQQAAVALVLLAASSGSRGMCASSPGLQAGYRSLHGLLHTLARRMPPQLSAALLPLVEAAGFYAADVEPATCAAMAGAPPGFCGALPGPSAPPSDASLCFSYQTAALLMAFVASCWMAYRVERRLRTLWLREFACSTGAEAFPEAATALSWELAAELQESVSDVDFVIGFAVPGCVILGLVAQVLG